MLCRECGDPMIIGPHELEGSEGVSQHVHLSSFGVPTEIAYDYHHVAIRMPPAEEVDYLLDGKERHAALEVFAEDILDSLSIAFQSDLETTLRGQGWGVVQLRQKREELLQTVRDYVANHYFEGAAR